MIKPFELVVFDWDGTLCDSSAKITRSMQHAIEELELPPVTEDEIKQYIGLDALLVIENLYPDIDRGTHVKLKQLFHYHYFSNKEDLPALYPGVIECLTELKNAGITLAVATGKSRSGLDIALERTGLDQLVSISRCAEETCSKPHPQMLQEILEVLMINSERALMVGDTTYDIELAQNADMKAVAITHGNHEKDTLLSYNPYAYFDNLSSFTQWLLELKE